MNRLCFANYHASFFRLCVSFAGLFLSNRDQSESINSWAELGMFHSIQRRAICSGFLVRKHLFDCTVSLATKNRVFRIISITIVYCCHTHGLDYFPYITCKQNTPKTFIILFEAAWQLADRFYGHF